MSDELAFASAAWLAGEIRAKRLSPVELVRALLARIERLNPHLNAFITVAAEPALADARAAEAAVMAGAALGPLHGVPFTVKDLIDTAGVRSTFASLLFADRVPAADGVAVARMKAAGGIMLGKVTTPEFGHMPMNEAPLFGRTRNPWDLARTPGGSSGGSAAAVAAGLGPLSIGTDAGGSIRIPAACCGIVGMKATLGLVPHDTAPDGFGNFSNQGPMTRTVGDAALMLDAMAGAHPADPHSHGLTPPGGFAAAARPEGDLSGRRIVWRPLMGNRLVDPEVAAMMEAAIEVLRGLGAEIERVEEPFENTEPYWLAITQSLWAARFGDYLAVRSGEMTPSLVRGTRQGLAAPAVDLQRAVMFRTQLFRRVQTWFADCDLLVTPTLARTALAVDHDFEDPVTIAGEVAGKIRQAWYPYTHPFNMTGHPAVTVPLGWHSDGLPAGLQIVGPMMGDGAVLRAAALYERARPWADRRPPLAIDPA